MSAAAFDFRKKQRREVLEGVQSANDVVSPAPGTAEAHQILLVRFPNWKSWITFRGELKRANIPATPHLRGREVSVFVRFADRDKAFDVLSQFRNQQPKTKRRFTRDYELTILLTAVSSIACMLVVFSTGNIIAALAMILTVLAAGLVYDRCRVNLRCTGSLRISVNELLVLTAMIASLIVAWQYAAMVAP